MQFQYLEKLFQHRSYLQHQYEKWTDWTSYLFSTTAPVLSSTSPATLHQVISLSILHAIQQFTGSSLNVLGIAKEGKGGIELERGPAVPSAYVEISYVRAEDHHLFAYLVKRP